MYKLTQEGEQALTQLKERSIKGIDEVGEDEEGTGNPWGLTRHELFLLQVIEVGEQYPPTFENGAGILTLRCCKLIKPA